MSRKTLLLLFSNIAVLTLLIFLQFLMFAFLPAISPGTSNQKDEALNFVFQKSLTIAIETILGLGALVYVNLKFVRLKNFLIIIFIDLLIVFSVAIMFALDYIGKY